MHQRDNQRLIDALRELTDIGNTVIVVEHDRDIMLASDYVIDLGPGAGKHGGAVVGEGTPTQFLAAETLTSQYLVRKKDIPVPTKRRIGSGKILTLRGATGNNLKNVAISIPLHTLTCITGVSGSGKSTLIRLLPRFYEPSAGQVLLDGRPISDYRLEDLRRQIALVGQRVMLFDGSIADNISYGQDRSDEAAIQQAADAANASEFINRLPKAMATPIGENGALLSGGQRQRVAIARAMLKNAPILILDEATAALDNESERLVQDALNHLIPDRTTLVIAHRLSTIEHADQVLVLDQGRLVEQGTHAQLLAQGGLYSHLHRMQFREEAERG